MVQGINAMKKIRWMQLAGVVVLLNGCALQPEQPGQVGPVRGPPAGLQSAPGSARANELPPAALALAHDADQAARRHDWERAARDLERALNIAPASALLWQRLAAVRFSQGHFRQVEALAHKSNTLAGNNSSLRRMNWRMIAAARSALGNHRGAEEASRRAAQLRP